jgi:hypothetical protein
LVVVLVCWWRASGPIAGGTGGASGASGPIVGATGGAGRPGTKKLAVGSEQQPCAKRGPPSKAPWGRRACTFANHKPPAPVRGICLNRRS